MSNIFLGLLAIVIWAIALVFFILTLVYFNKRKQRRNYFILFLVLVAIPFLPFAIIEIKDKIKHQKYLGEYIANKNSPNEAVLLLTKSNFTLKTKSCKPDSIYGNWERQQFFSGEQIILKGPNIQYIKAVASENLKTITFNDFVPTDKPSDNCFYIKTVFIKN